MFMELRRALSFTAVSMLLFGGGYHMTLWVVAEVVFSSQAEGSLIRRADGTIVGSRLIAQAFTRTEYFLPRPSPANYDAESGAGSNFGPSNPHHLAKVRDRLTATASREKVVASEVPSEMVTASGSGLDPHISPAAAGLQARRIAASRGVSVEDVRALIDRYTQPPTFGFVGQPRVNVLELNLALDQAFGAPVSR